MTTFFTRPKDPETREPLDWLSLPVVDKLWNSQRAHKGGFIQQATGWKHPFFSRLCFYQL